MIPASARRRNAYQGGYNARLQGRSRYACPYEETRGWQAALAISWWDGWHEADEQLAPPGHGIEDNDVTVELVRA